ncbi:alpha-galactosidase [Streptomonospora litoralis]|uniref:alpha-galactosidase n=1 Tax=Streptomonospora litoralis TaxID=2498135 RepID=A0A4P6Q257_9ACTN|nr:alpha-galactosidase [Streptomonospora litoralis]QBI52834.1 Alpha-galactosidase [Streptomonospora litoralis]
MKAPTPPTATDDPVVVLRRAGVCLVVDLAPEAGCGLPEVLHWGADIGPLAPGLAEHLRTTSVPAVPNSAPDTPRGFTVLPTQADAWAGTPGLSGHRAGTATAPRLALRDHALTREDAADILTLDLHDPGIGLAVELRYRLDSCGVLHVQAAAAADPWPETAGQEAPAESGAAGPAHPAAPYDLAALRVLLPLPPRAAEILDPTGRWVRERSPQRRDIADGTVLRRALRGRPGHDSPLLVVAGTRGFGFGTGEVWAAHVAWSGDQEYLVERLPEGAGAHSAVLGGAEALHPGEIRLAPGESYRGPEVVFAHSAAGLDGLSAHLHSAVRARPEHPRDPRPIVLNTWEAVYFDHDLDRLRDLADRAAAVGVERFVLDDGWFLGRRDDRAGLGDWTVDPDTWPEGLDPVIDHVHALGMDFGLWVEPEMANVDSDLVRADPGRLLHPEGGPGRSWRHQYVLDIARPDTWRHIHDRLDALLRRYPIRYLKWDHNRDLYEAVHAPAGDSGPEAGRVPGVHRQTRALYALLDSLRERHPGVEFESCASGGARIDLGILARTERVWASDCNDPVERQSIQRWTGLLLPPELVGAHAGPPVAHTTHRRTETAFRLGTALFGHAGIEWDLTACDERDLAALTAWTALVREFRTLLHTGRTVRGEETDPGALLHGVVSHSGERALFCYARLETSPAEQPGRTPLPGLDADRRYTLHHRTDLGDPTRGSASAPAWMHADTPEPVLTGAALHRLGLPMPRLFPAQAVLIEALAQRESPAGEE